MTETLAWQYAYLSIGAKHLDPSVDLAVYAAITTSTEKRALPNGTCARGASMIGQILAALDVVGADGWQVSSYNSSGLGSAHSASWYEAWLRRPAP